MNFESNGHKYAQEFKGTQSKRKKYNKKEMERIGLKIEIQNEKCTGWN